MRRVGPASPGNGELTAPLDPLGGCTAPPGQAGLPHRGSAAAAPRCPAFGERRGALRDAVDDEAGEVDEEEVVRVPEDLEVVPADELGGGRDHEDERQRDDDSRQPRDGGESHILDGLQGWQAGLGKQGTGGGGGGLDARAGTHRLVGVDGVQPLAATLQVHLGEDGGEAAVGGLLAVVVTLQVEEVGDGVHGWTGGWTACHPPGHPPRPTVPQSGTGWYL